MIVPKLTKLDNSIIPYMYEIGWRLITIYNEIMYWEKEEKKVRSWQAVTTWDDFENFWKLYPRERRKKKKEASDFWYKLEEKKRTLAIEGLKKYLVYWKKTNQDLNFISMPYYWLKWERYLDEWLDDAPKNPIAETLRSEIEEEKKLEEDRKWMDLQLAKLKASGKWDEWYTKAREETPENQRQFEYLIITRIKQRIRMNITK